MVVGGGFGVGGTELKHTLRIAVADFPYDTVTLYAEDDANKNNAERTTFFKEKNTRIQHAYPDPDCQSSLHQANRPD